MQPDVSARGKKKMTIFLPSCRVNEKRAVSVAMSMAGTVSPVVSIRTSYGWADALIYGMSSAQMSLACVIVSYYGLDCKTGEAHHVKNKMICGFLGRQWVS
jgi:hypothetical protein